MTPVTAFDYKNHPAAQPAEGQSDLLSTLPQELLLMVMHKLSIPAQIQTTQVSTLLNRIIKDSSLMEENLKAIGVKLTGTPEEKWAALTIWNRKVEGDEFYGQKEIHWAKLLGPLFYKSLPEMTHTIGDGISKRMKAFQDKKSNLPIVRVHTIDEKKHISSFMFDVLLQEDEEIRPAALEVKLMSGQDEGKIPDLDTKFYFYVESPALYLGRREGDLFHRLFENPTQKYTILLSDDDDNGYLVPTVL